MAYYLTHCLLLLLQPDLIGTVKETKADERRRKAAHAEWLAEQDRLEMKAIMDKIKNGYGRGKEDDYLSDEVSKLPCQKLLSKEPSAGCGWTPTQPD